MPAAMEMFWAKCQLAAGSKKLKKKKEEKKKKELYIHIASTEYIWSH